MTITYRGAGPWGAGKGSNLTASDFDNNTWSLVQLINDKAIQGVGLVSFTIIGDELWATLSDHTILGPYTLPVVQISFVGTWQPSSQYYVNQIFTAGNNTYIVLVNHTSALTFDAGANDGHGNNYYGLLLSPPQAIPTGGAIGMVLTKSGSGDYVTAWQWPTFEGLHDVLQSPGPINGQLVYFNGSLFSYLNQDEVHAAPQNLADLADVLASPSPGVGYVVYWNGTNFGYLPQSDIVAAPPSLALAALSDVLPSPAPISNQIVYWNGSAFTYETPSVGILSDVGVGWYTPVENDDILVWDVASSQWVNRPFIPYQYGVISPPYTFALTDSNTFNDISTSGTLTIPPNSSVAFPPGAIIWVRQFTSSGPVTIAAGVGVTLTVLGGRLAQTRAIGSVIAIQQSNVTDTWNIMGDLAYNNSPGLPTTGTWNLDATLGDQETFPWTPTGSNTINVVSGGAPFGRRMTFVITTSGTSSWTITFGTRFKSTGTLATGTVSGKVFVIEFVGDGTNFNEVSRTVAM